MIICDKATGDSLENVIFKRNEYVKQTYHCDIEVDTFKKIVSKVESLVGTGDSTYDLYMDKARDIAALSTKGLLSDINVLPQVELDKVWWDQAFFRDTSINGKNYMLVGDLVTPQPIAFTHNIQREVGPFI